MAKLIYIYLPSLDGYIADERGNFDWTVPYDEVNALINDLVRPVGTYLYGRRMYETMTGWETDPAFAAQSPQPHMRDFAEIWQAADKIVYSTSLATVATARTRIERAFDPDAVRRLKDEADRDLTVGGANLAAHAIAAGLVDEWHLFVGPMIVGGGRKLFPDNVRVRLDLLDERRFGNGTVYLRYRTAT